MVFLAEFLQLPVISECVSGDAEGNGSLSKVGCSNLQARVLSPTSVVVLLPSAIPLAATGRSIV